MRRIGRGVIQPHPGGAGVQVMEDTQMHRRWRVIITVHVPQDEAGDYRHDLATTTTVERYTLAGALEYAREHAGTDWYGEPRIEPQERRWARYHDGGPDGWEWERTEPAKALGEWTP